MLVFNEGMPRAGKSYDAVKSHILPALVAGRRVYARLNGLDHEKIAAFLGLDLARVRELLVLVPTADVLQVFRAVNDRQHGWSIPAHLKDALFVVDEAHEFYVADRLPIDPPLEQFFSLHGQNGMDGVLLSQYYRRLHSSVRCRIERKNLFQKLSAVSLDGSYLVRRYHATGPERFELVTSDTCKYDKAIFPLYSGYAPGAGNAAVYKAGGATVWKRVAKYAIFIVPAVVAAIWLLSRFFTGSGGLVTKHAMPTASRAPTVQASAAPAHILPVVPGGGNLLGRHGREQRVAESELRRFLPQTSDKEAIAAHVDAVRDLRPGWSRPLEKLGCRHDAAPVKVGVPPCERVHFLGLCIHDRPWCCQTRTIRTRLAILALEPAVKSPLHFHHLALSRDYGQRHRGLDALLVQFVKVFRQFLPQARLDARPAHLLFHLGLVVGAHDGKVTGGSMARQESHGWRLQLFGLAFRSDPHRGRRIRRSRLVA